MTPIPGSPGVDHAGYTVPDLEQAVAFFTDVLGCQLVYRVGPYADPDGTTMTDYLGVDRTATATIAVLRCGSNLNIELVEFAAPDQDTRSPMPTDHGGRHLALAVDDLDAAVAFLDAHPSVDLLPGENPPPDPNGPEAGLRSRYFRSPWGMMLEVIERAPHDATRKLVRP